jgi:hypothetical protein
LTPKRPGATPGWLLWLATPFVARMIASSMAKEHPGQTPAQIADRMRADLGTNPDPRALALVNAVERYLPQPARGAEVGTHWPSGLALVAANLLPLYGVVVLGWEVFPLMLLFWLENVIVGVLNAARMLCVDPHDVSQWAAKLVLVPFFCVHYGMFTAIHGVFVLSFFGADAFGRVDGLQVLDVAGRAVQELGLGVAVLALAASHLFSLFWNFLGRGEFRRATVPALMMQPYGRVVVLHLAIIGGGFAAAALGSPAWALVVLLALKVGLDLRAHLKEHRARSG